jgi:hypothetical protein
MARARYADLSKPVRRYRVHFIHYSDYDEMVVQVLTRGDAFLAVAIAAGRHRHFFPNDAIYEVRVDDVGPVAHDEDGILISEDDDIVRWEEDLS